MSPIEFNRELEAADELRREQYERVIALAWYAAAFDNDLRAGKLKSLQATIEQCIPRAKPEARKKPKQTDIAGQLRWLGIPKRPMSEETRAAMWKPPSPVKADG